MTTEISAARQAPPRPGRGLVLAGARLLNVLQGMALVWGVVLGAVIIAAPGSMPPQQLLGVESLRSSSLGAAVLLNDLPLGARLASGVGTAAFVLAWALLLGAAARVARKVATGLPSGPAVAGTLRRTAAGLGTAAIVLSAMTLVAVGQVEGWVDGAAAAEWGELIVQTAGVPVGSVLGLLMGALAVSILARAFGGRERLRQDTAGPV